MPTMNFPSLPTLGDEYLFNSTTYVYDGTKWVAKQSNEQNINQMIESHKVGVDQHNIAGIQGLADALSKTGDAVLDVKWLSKRSPMRTGYTAGDGQTLSRALYPDALAAIQAGLVPVCPDAEWLSNPAKRGCFTLGDGSTTFRVPDYNGVQSYSYGPVYLGGGNSSGGNILQDRIQNFSGRFQFDTNNNNALADGVFKRTPGTSSNWIGSGASVARQLIELDLAQQARVGDTTCPITVEGCLAIKLFGAVQNVGSADAAVLATAVADLAARVSVLEQRKSTCLVNAAGTGAPHETVVSQLPSNVTRNTRYVLPNPFGVNTPVECWAEVFANNKWARAGFIYVAASGGFGTAASYVQGDGIVVQTGLSTVLTTSSNSGSGHGISTDVVSAPCRVFVRKLEA